jgi:hypothetical protein
MSGTFRIDAAGWRALFIENMQRLGNFVSQNGVLTPEGLTALHQHLDRAKTIAAAWCAATPAPAAHEPEPPAASEPVRVQATGVPLQRSKSPIPTHRNGAEVGRRGRAGRTRGG